MNFLSRQSHKEQDGSSRNACAGRRRDLSQSLDEVLLHDDSRQLDDVLLGGGSAEADKLSASSGSSLDINIPDADGVPVSSLSAEELKAFEAYASNYFGNDRRLAWEDFAGRLPSIREELKDVEPDRLSVVGHYVSDSLSYAGNTVAGGVSRFFGGLRKTYPSVKSHCSDAARMSAMITFGLPLSLFPYKFTEKIWNHLDSKPEEKAAMFSAISALVEAGFSVYPIIKSASLEGPIVPFSMAGGLFLALEGSVRFAFGVVVDVTPLPSLVTAVPSYVCFGAYKGAGWLGRTICSGIKHGCGSISEGLKKIPYGIQHTRSKIKEDNIDRILDKYKPGDSGSSDSTVV